MIKVAIVFFSVIFTVAVSAKVGDNVIILPGDECRYAIDLYHVQDVSESYEDDVASLRKQVTNLRSSIDEMYPGSRMGVATFVDKPATFCDGVEFCFKNVAPIGSSTKNIKAKLNKYASSSWGGGDYQENALGAMIRAAMSPKVGWNREMYDEATGLPVRRIMMVSTDGVPHMSDYFNRSRQLAGVDTPNKGECGWPTDYKPFAEMVTPETLEEDDNVACLTSEFPSWQEWADTMHKYHIVPLFLVGNWSYYAPFKGKDWWYPRYYSEYFSTDPELKEVCDHDDGLLPYYQIMMRRYGVNGFAARIESDSSDLTEVALKLLSDLPQLICDTTTTTTPTTTTPTTATTTTSTTKAPITDAPVTEAPITDAPVTEAPVTDAPNTEKPAPVPVVPTSPSGDGTTTFLSTSSSTQEDTTTAAAGGGGSPGAVIGGAAAGAVVALAGAALYVKKFGVSMPFSRDPAVDLPVEQDVDMPETPQERETYETVNADMFT